MARLRGCEFPSGLLYHPEHNVWLRAEDQDTFSLGMTAYAVALAGDIVAYTPKRAGSMVASGRSCAVVESSKWVGPVKTPVGGQVLAVNQAAMADPGLLNREPYSGGWVVRIRAQGWQGACAGLLSGAAALAALERNMEADGFTGCE